MAGAKLLRSLSFFLAVSLVSYITESAFTGTLTSAGLTFTLPTLSTLTQTQLVYLTAGGLSLGAAAGLAGLAVASRLLADGGSGGSSATGYGAPTGYSEPSSGYGAPSSGYDAPSSGYDSPSSGYDAPSSGYQSPSSGGGHGHSRTLEEEAQAKSVPKFHYQWQQKIANLGRRKRAATEEESVNLFLDSLSSVDKSDCGKLYLCEISATPEPELLSEDRNTLELLRKTYNKRLESQGRKQFDYAWQIGAKFGVDVCRKQFRKCTIRGIVSLVKYGTLSADTL